MTAKSRWTLNYFGGAHEGGCSPGVGGKVLAFWPLKRGGRLFARVIQDASSRTLPPIVERRIASESTVYGGHWRAWDALDVSAFAHQLVNQEGRFAKAVIYINGIENFRSQAKRHLLDSTARRKRISAFSRRNASGGLQWTWVFGQLGGFAKVYRLV